MQSRTCSQFFNYGAIFFTLVFIVAITAVAIAERYEAANTRLPKKVLILSSYSPDFPLYTSFVEGVKLRLAEDTAAEFEIYHESLDSLRFLREDSFRDHLASALYQKYAANQPDVVITHGDFASAFICKYGSEMFGGTPAILTAYVPGAEAERYQSLPANYILVAAMSTVPRNVQLILNLKPETKRIYIIFGASTGEQNMRAIAAQELKAVAQDVEIIYLDNLAFPDLPAYVGQLKGDTAILFRSFQRDVQGNDYVPAEAAVKAIAGVASVPVFASTETHLGSGAVGGYMDDTRLLARYTAEKALLALEGHQFPNNSIEKVDVSKCLFDRRALKRWHIDESRLPPNSIIDHRPPNVWTKHRGYIMGAAVILLLEAALIFLLLRNSQRRKRAEQEQARLKQRFEDFFNYSATAMAVFGLRDLKLSDVNPAWEQLFGYAREEVIGRTAADLGLTAVITPEDGEYTAATNCFGILQKEVEARNRVGRPLKLIISTTSLRGDSEVQGLVSLVDVTDFRRMEAEMSRKERLNQMGEIAASIAHEIKQPLTSLRFVAEAALYWYAENQPPSRESVVQSLELIKTQVDKIESIIENVRSIIEHGQLAGERNPVDLNQVIVNILQIIKDELAENFIMVKTNLAEQLPPVYGTAIQLEEVIMNLVRNAMVALQSVPESDRRITLTTYEEDYVILEVSDNGPGIPEEIAENIFEAFYTTKGDKGLGIGLALARRVTELFRGSLKLVPSARGATFQLKLHTYHEGKRYYADFTCR